jgi:apolipoprotein N-acyltransferase
VLITGGLRLAPNLPTNSSVRGYNSIFVIDHNGAVLSVYDKVHLVPIGEYLPLESWLEKLDLTRFLKLSNVLLAGDGHRNLSVPGAPDFSPLICYEIIFPDEAVPRGERPGWIVNVSNDGWFGVSIGPYQHFQQARVRAIEQGLPLVRAANTGISAIVDPLGRVIISLPLDAIGVIDGPLPRRVAPTLYAKYGDGIVGLIIFFSIALILFDRRFALMARWKRPIN